MNRNELFPASISLHSGNLSSFSGRLDKYKRDRCIKFITVAGGCAAWRFPDSGYARCKTAFNSSAILEYPASGNGDQPVVARSSGEVPFFHTTTGQKGKKNPPYAYGGFGVERFCARAVYIMPPMPPMPPIPPPGGMAGAAASFSGLSATIASVVSIREATLAAF